MCLCLADQVSERKAPMISPFTHRIAKTSVSLLFLLTLGTFARAQEVASNTEPAGLPTRATESSSLPDAPIPNTTVVPGTDPFGQTSTAKYPTAGKVAPVYDKTIQAGWSAQPLTAKQKIVLESRDLFGLASLEAIVLSAGYSHVTNGSPNYGTNSKAFAQRLGATAARDTSEDLFAYGILDPLLHQDPRYYVLGRNYNFFHRIVYAGTRTLITRTDSGHNTLNSSLLIGYAGGSALSYVYYPQINKNFNDTARTYGGSLGGAALGFLVSEFTSDVLQAVHLQKRTNP
jgi:hypothetical protein